MKEAPSLYKPAPEIQMFAVGRLSLNWSNSRQEAQLKQGLADRTAKTAVSVAI